MNDELCLVGCFKVVGDNVYKAWSLKKFVEFDVAKRCGLQSYR